MAGLYDKHSILNFRRVEELDRLKRFMLGLPVAKKQGPNTPWGYVKKAKADGTEYYEPIEPAIKLLVEAKYYLLNGIAGYRPVSEWLSKESGISISPWGLQKLMQTRMPDDRAASLTRKQREALGRTLSF
jgi:hypothetical protein